MTNFCCERYNVLVTPTIPAAASTRSRATCLFTLYRRSGSIARAPLSGKWVKLIVENSYKYCTYQYVDCGWWVTSRHIKVRAKPINRRQGYHYQWAQTDQRYRPHAPSVVQSMTVQWIYACRESGASAPNPVFTAVPCRIYRGVSLSQAVQSDPW